MTAALMTAPFVVVVDYVHAESTVFEDMAGNEYWAKDMVWAIDNGYIGGYVNQKHPTTGKHGNWLNPNGNLTESQMLAVTLRYKVGVAEYNKLSTKYASQIKSQNFAAYGSYAKAKELGMVTKGSTSNKAPQNQTVTRGQLAQALVSMHYGKSVTVNEAIEFMYANNLSSGIKPELGKTVANYGANNALKRAHIVTFLKGYDTVVKSNKVVDIAKFAKTPPKAEVQQPQQSFKTFKEGIFMAKKPAKQTDDVVGKKIKTKFGERAYGTKTQAEYDAVMKVVEGFKMNKDYLDKIKVNPDKNLEQAFNEYKAGKRGTKDRMTPQYIEGTNPMLVAIEKDRPDSLMQYIKTFDDYVLSMKVGELSNRLAPFSKPAPKGFDPTSAYDLFVKNWDDCTSYAYGMMALYDQMSIDGFVLHSPYRVHDYYVINLHGKWYAFGNGLEEVTPDFLKSGDRILEAPSSGISTLPSHLQKIYKPTN